MELTLKVQSQTDPTKWIELDLFENEGIALVKTLKDVNDLSKLFSDFTRAFNVPASKVNNQYFGYFYDFDVEGSFNQNAEASAIIEFKGIELVTGKIELNGSLKRDARPESYSITFYGAIKSLSELFGADTLQDIDWSSFEHILNKSNITASWDLNLFGGDVLYPLWDCGNERWWYDSNTGNTDPRNIANISGSIAVDTLKPALRISAMLTTIFAQYGKVIKGDWISDADTLKTYVQPQREAGSSTQADKLAYNLEWQNNTPQNITPTLVNYLFPVEIYDNGGSFDGTTYTAQYKGQHTLQWQLVLTAVPRDGLQILYSINGHITVWGTSNGTGFKTIGRTFNLNQGDTVVFWLGSADGNTHLIASSILRKLEDTNSQAGNADDFSQRMPEIGVAEFVDGILKTYHLVIEPLNNTDFKIEPNETWYNDGKLIDYSAFVDKASLAIKKVKLFAKLEFEFKSPATRMHVDFKSDYDRGFGSTEFDAKLGTGIDYATGTLKIDSPFALPIPQGLINVATGNFTGIQSQDFYDKEDAPVLSELNLFYYNGLFASPDYYIGGNAPAKQEFYPNCTSVGVEFPISSDNSLSFSLETALNGITPVNTLYQRFWNQYIRRLYDSDTKIVIASAIIPIAVFLELKLNDIIVIDGQAYTINKYEYNFLTEKAKLDLVTYDQVTRAQVLEVNSDGQIILDDALVMQNVDVKLYTGTRSTAGSDTVFIQTNVNALQLKAEVGQEDNMVQTTWRGEWVEGSYPPESIVIQDGWLMISNKTTDEIAAPQPIGPGGYLIEPYEPATQDDTSIIYSGHIYDFAIGGWLKSIRVWVPIISATTSYRVIVINNSDPSNPKTTILDNLNLTANQWNIVSTGNDVFASGTSLIIYLVSDNSSATTSFDDRWNYSGSCNNCDPPALSWNTRNSDSEIRFQYQSLGLDYETQLLALIPNSTVTITQISDTARFKVYRTLLLPIDGGTFCEIDSELLDEGNNIQSGEECTIDFTSPVPLPTDYSEQLNYWNTFPPPSEVVITPVLQFDGVDQFPSVNSAFGVDILVQGANVSEDWDILSFTEGFVDDGSTAAIQEVISNILLGSHYNEDGVPIVSSDTNWETVSTNETDFLRAANYMFEFSLVANQDKTNRMAFYRVLVDSNVVSEFSIKANDKDDNLAFAQNSILIPLLTDGDPLVELQIMVEHNQLDVTLIRFSYNLKWWSSL